MKGVTLFFTLILLAAFPSFLKADASCSDATELSCGPAVYFPPSATSHFGKTNYDLTACTNFFWSYDGHDRLFTFDAGVTAKDLVIRLTGLTADQDLLIFRSCSGAGQFSNCVGVSLKSSTNNEEIAIPGATGLYYIVVDGYAYGSNGGYNLEVSCDGSTTPPSSPTGCYDAPILTCGATKWVNQSTVNNYTKSNYNTSGCYGSGTADYKGMDHIYRVDVGPGTKDIDISITGLTANLDLLLFKSCGSSYSNSLSSCVAVSINSGSANERIVLKNATGTYYLMVDGAEAWDKSGYEISMKCNDPYVPSNNCYDAIPLKCGQSKWVSAATKNSFDKTSYNLSGCAAQGYDYKGMDHLYRIDLGSGSKDIKIILSGLSADLDLLLFKECGSYYGSNGLSSCVASSIKSGNSTETIQLSNASGTYYLSVDAADPWDKSSYDIQLICNEYTNNYDCYDAIPLTCGQSKWVSAATKNHFDKSSYSLSGCSWQTYDYTGMDHLYRIDVGYSPKDIKIMMTGLSADLDLLLFKACGSYYGSNGLSSCVATSVRSGNSSEVIELPNASGTYYLSVDAADPWDKSGYEIQLICNEHSYGYDCSEAIPLKCGENRWVNAATNNHLDKSNYNLSGCLSSTYGLDYKGNDHLYRIDAGNAKTHLSIKMSGLSADLDLLLFKSCNSSYGNTQLGSCVAYSLHTGNSTETIELDNASGVYYLAVDAADPWDKSGYEISVKCQSYPSYDCNNATTLTCGTSKWVDKPTVNHFNKSNYYLAGCSTYNYDYDGMDHLYRVDAGYGSSSLTINVTGLTANMDVLVFRACSSNYSSPHFQNCAGYSAKSGKSNEKVVIENASGVYYIIVDAADPWDKSGYEISVDCYTAPTYDCNNATVLTCGTSKWVNAPTKNNLDRTNYSASGCYNSSSNYTGNDHLYKINVGSTKKTLKIKMTGLTDNMDLLLFDACSNTSTTVKFTDCVGSSQKSGNSSEEILLENASGTYYLVVDADDPWDNSGYEISVNCETPNTTYDCSNASPLSCGANEWVEAATVNHFNKESYDLSDCFNSSYSYQGLDRLYKINVGTSAKDLKIKMSGLGDDLDMFLFKTCSTTGGKVRFSDCQAYSKNLAKADEEIVLKDASGTYYLVVDAEDPWAISSFKLLVDCVIPSTDPDPDPIDPDPVDPTEPDPCFSYKFGDDDTVEFDLRKAHDTGCNTNHKLTIYSVDPETDEVSSSGTEVTILEDSTASFEVMASSELQKFMACFQSICVGETKVCCIGFSISPILTCGNTYEGTTRGASSNFAIEDLASCFQTNLGYAGADQLVRFEKANADDILQITMTQSGANLSLFILNEDLTTVPMDCKGLNYNATKQVSNSAAVGEVYSDAGDPLPAGVYYALVEGYSPGVEGDFTLSIACGIDCSESIALDCDANLTSLSNNDAPSNQSMYVLGDTTLIVGYIGGELVYSFTLTEEQAVELSTTNASGDIDLFIVEGGCEEGSIIASSMHDGHADESINVTLAAGDYLLIVDSWNETGVSFDLSSMTCDISAAIVGQGASARSSGSSEVLEDAVQISPNPFSDQAIMKIMSSEAAVAQVSFYSIEGKQITSRAVTLHKGVNTITINDQLILDQKGLIYYTISTDNQLLKGKMIKL